MHAHDQTGQLHASARRAVTALRLEYGGPSRQGDYHWALFYAAFHVRLSVRECPITLSPSATLALLHDSHLTSDKPCILVRSVSV